GHEQPDGARRTQLVEEPVGQYVQAERGPDRGLEQNAIEQLTSDRHAGRPGHARFAIARVHDRDVEGSAPEVDRDLNPVMLNLADHRRGWFSEEGDLCEARR